MNSKMIEKLRSLEWSGEKRGPGSGPMGSGNDGALYPSCPECGGIEPSPTGPGDFIASAYGHRPTCDFGAILREFDTEKVVPS